MGCWGRLWSSNKIPFGEISLQRSFFTKRLSTGPAKHGLREMSGPAYRCSALMKAVSQWETCPC